MNGSPPRSPRRILLICNPISGGGRSRSLGPALAAALQRHGVATEVHFTSSSGDASERARRAGGEAWDGLVGVGGDGTLNEVLNGMPDPTLPLGMLPVGTANVLAAELGLPAEPDAAAAVIAAGRRRPLAIGRCRADLRRGDGRRFLLFCGVGVDGAVVRRLAEVRTGTLGKHKWLGPILHTVRHWPRYELSATMADGTRIEGLSSVLVTRVRNYGGMLHLPASVDVDDGQLHVLCFRQRTRTAWLWQGARALCGRMRAGPSLEVLATTAVHIEGEAPFQIDGDFGGTSPVAIDTLPQPAQVFAPPHA